MLNSIVSLTEQLVGIKSIPENPKALDKALQLAIAQLKGFTIEKFEHNGVKSALVYNTKKRPKKFKLILNGHLDVIPGKDYQYIAQTKGNRLYGVGVMDMKANLACMIMAFRQVAHDVNYPVALQLTTDEELGGFDGTQYQITKGVRAEFVLAGEPTNFDIVSEAKGILWLKISTRGKTAHGAYPWRGDNAIWKMNEFLNSLRKIYPVPLDQEWITTVNLSTIATDNQVFNKIPDDCVIGLDIRFIPKDAKTVLSTIKKLAPKGFKIEVLANEPALFTKQTNPYVKALQQVVEGTRRKAVVIRGAQGSSDARHFAPVGCPGIEFGPIGGGIGSEAEWVDVPSLEIYFNILSAFMRSIG